MEQTPLNISQHASQRMRERRITAQMIQDTIDHGEMLHRQGLRFFVMTRKATREFFDGEYARIVMNTVVVLDWDDTVKTVYQNENALKNIRKKSKRLSIDTPEIFRHEDEGTRRHRRNKKRKSARSLSLTSEVERRLGEMGLTADDLILALENSRHINLPGDLDAYLVRGTAELRAMPSEKKSKLKGLKVIQSNDGKVFSIKYDRQFKSRRVIRTEQNPTKAA